MKVFMKPIEIIAWFKEESFPIPLRFRIDSENKTKLVIKIDKILFQEEEKFGGNKMIVYRCEGIIQNLNRIFEIKYDIATCRWFLFKM